MKIKNLIYISFFAATYCLNSMEMALSDHNARKIAKQSTLETTPSLAEIFSFYSENITLQQLCLFTLYKKLRSDLALGKEVTVSLPDVIQELYFEFLGKFTQARRDIERQSLFLNSVEGLDFLFDCVKDSKINTLKYIVKFYGNMVINNCGYVHYTVNTDMQLWQLILLMNPNDSDIVKHCVEHIKKFPDKVPEDILLLVLTRTTNKECAQNIMALILSLHIKLNDVCVFDNDTSFSGKTPLMIALKQQITPSVAVKEVEPLINPVDFLLENGAKLHQMIDGSTIWDLLETVIKTFQKNVFGKLRLVNKKMLSKKLHKLFENITIIKCFLLKNNENIRASDVESINQILDSYLATLKRCSSHLQKKTN